MARPMTSTKPEKSKKESLKKTELFPVSLKNPVLVKEILVDALMQNDLDTFQDVLIGYIRTASKSDLAAKSKLGRQTLYDLIDEDKEFNPTLSTLGAILKCIAA